MSDKNELPLNILAELEQIEATLVNFAPILASFYQALLKANVPDTLACQLVSDYFAKITSKIGNA